ncbi:MAG: hypothetical protein HYS13_13545 [Planctomycetia bacterium]|nr:hypothetical protein [Planctomycetia bacterium]
MTARAPQPPQAPTPRRPAPRRFAQFSLRALLLWVGLVGLGLSVMSWAGPMWSVLIGWVLILVAAHVTANAWGTRSATQPPDEDQLAERDAWAAPRRVSCAPATPLRRSFEGGRARWVTALIAAVAGGVLGICYLQWAMSAPRWYGLLMGGLATAVIGGLLGFLLSSFLQVIGVAVGDARRVL